MKNEINVIKIKVTVSLCIKPFLNAECVAVAIEITEIHNHVYSTISLKIFLFGAIVCGLVFV